jgi:hypothetical protein
MPQVEAGACGVPIATVNYSAMCDIVNKLNAYPIKIKSEFKELETKAIRVYPDNDDLAKYILDFIKQPDSILNKKRFEIHELTHKHYDWTNIAKKWENYLDKLDNSGYRANWNNSNFLEPIQSMPDSNISNNFDNILMLLYNNLKDISLIGSQKILELLNHADYGFIQSGPTNIGPFSFKEVYEYLKTIVDNNNQAKSAQDSNVSFDEDFIAYSNMKRNS